MTLNGVDMSHYQTVTDWGALAKAADFVILKATEGTTYQDPTYTVRIPELRVRGVRVGAYHFASTSTPIAEADAFLAYSKLRPDDIAALDVEAGILTRLPGQQLVTWCKTWLDHVKVRTGITPYIYLNLSTINGRDWSSVAAVYPLWLAWPSSTTIRPTVKYWTAPVMWQHNPAGTVAGIKGNVDLDTLYTTPAVTVTKPVAPSAPTTITDPKHTTSLENLMASVTFTDANEMTDLIAKGMPEDKAREEATVTYTNETTAIAGALSFLSSILRDMAILKAEVAALKPPTA